MKVSVRYQEKKLSLLDNEKGLLDQTKKKLRRRYDKPKNVVRMSVGRLIKKFLLVWLEKLCESAGLFLSKA